MHSRARARGFTLLEAIVALVIFSLGAFALFGWLSTNVITLQRVAEQQRAVEGVASALELVARLNPMLEPQGRREVGDLQVEWKSVEVRAPEPGSTQVGRPTMFDVALYDVQVTVLEDGDEVDRFTVRRVGHRQARAMEFE